MDSKEEDALLRCQRRGVEVNAAYCGACSIRRSRCHRGSQPQPPPGGELFGVNMCGADGATCATLPAHVRQLDAPTNTSMAVQRPTLRVQLLLCLAFATRGFHGAPGQCGAVGQLPTAWLQPLEPQLLQM